MQRIKHFLATTGANYQLQPTDPKFAPPMINRWNDSPSILAPMRAAKLKVPAQEQFSRRPRSYGPEVERRAESGIRPGGEPQATDPHLMWVDLSSWSFPYVRLCMQLRAQAQVCLGRKRKAALGSKTVLALVAWSD